MKNLCAGLFFLTVSFFNPLNSFSSVKNTSIFINYTGKLNNKIEVVFSLTNTNGKIHGFYYYDKIGVEIKLSGEVKNGNAVMYELDYQNKKQARITGRFTKNGFVGTWKSLTAKKFLPMILKQINTTIPALPKNIVGTYKTEEEKNCLLSFSILKIKGEYFYNYKSSTRNLKGKVTFSRSLTENLVYINFNGIEWLENSGDVTDDKENPASEENLPTVVQGVFNEGQITIQNYGNAMNRYVKLGECEPKYVHLKLVL